jgi:hypothetical protein
VQAVDVWTMVQTAMRCAYRLLPLAGPPRASVVATLRGLILACADLLHHGDLEGAWVMGVVLSGAADPQCDAADRLVLTGQ